LHITPPGLHYTPEQYNERFSEYLRFPHKIRHLRLARSHRRRFHFSPPSVSPSPPSPNTPNRKPPSPPSSSPYDTRFYSEEFSALAVDILQQHGIRAILCDTFTPTPAVAYEIQRSKLDGAVNFTASHNPANTTA